MMFVNKIGMGLIPVTVDSFHKSFFTSLLNGVLHIKELCQSRVVDSNKLPFVQKGVWVDKHIGNGDVVWHKNKFAKLLYPLESQKEEDLITGIDFQKEIMQRPVMNATVLDWLLENPSCIPSEWKGKKIFFWGTIYRDGYDELFVRYLDQTCSRLSWSLFPVSHVLDGVSYALCVE
jgi:hypothetical protein